MKNAISLLLVLSLVFTPFVNVSASSGFDPNWKGWRVHESSTGFSVHPSSEFDSKISAQYKFEQVENGQIVHFTLIEEGRVIARKTSFVPRYLTQEAGEKLSKEFFGFWKQIVPQEIALGKKKSHWTIALAEMLVPAAHANIDVFVGMGSGMLLGVGFFAFMIGHAMYKAGQESDFLGLGLVVFGGLIRAGGGIAMLAGGATACRLFL